MATVGVLQHFWCEPAVVFEEALVDSGHHLTHVELFNGQALPSKDAFDAWLIMGGPMNVDETERHPYLSAERHLLAELIALDRPVMGICLGAQLIARALGACVYPKRPKEIGLYTVEITAQGRNDPLFQLMSNPQQVFQWHGDTFDLPPGAVQLARSRRFENQAFRLGRRVYAVQFHIEADFRIACQWRHQWADEIAVLPEEDQVRINNGDLESALSKQNQLARRFVAAWANLFD